MKKVCINFIFVYFLFNMGNFFSIVVVLIIKNNKLFMNIKFSIKFYVFIKCNILFLLVVV